VLSSEQALEDYFSALLDEEAEQLDEAQASDDISALSDGKSDEFVPQLQPAPKEIEEVEHFSTKATEIELPNLDDVQRLLNQLEQQDPVHDLADVEELIVQNTERLGQQATVTVVEPEVVEPVVEEIQEWDLEVAEDVIPEPLVEVVEESTVLEEELVEPEVEVASVETTPQVDDVVAVEDVVEEVVETEIAPETQAAPNPLTNWESTQRQEDFQVLYFEVNGVTFAVPLDELGGIHRLESVNHLLGRPKWYLGLQTSRENQLDVVDTARWVMADKLVNDDYKESYQYIVMLGESAWGLSCGELRGTELLNVDKVRWREQAGKRPWLAGMVKEKMCALIHVEALIAMLNAGLDVKSLDK
jgi:purine-binding chemotaxis protein CheW